MNRSDVLRQLYEALDMLDARQTGAAQVIDLRDGAPLVLGGTLRHSVRTLIGTTWDLSEDGGPASS